MTPPPLPPNHPQPPPLPDQRNHTNSSRTVAIIVSAIALCLVGYLALGLLTNAVNRNSPAEKAREFANIQVSEKWRKCGGSWFTSNPQSGGNFDPWNFAEAKGLTSDVRSKTLNDVDKLNGIEWKGEVTYTTAALRYHYPHTGGFPPRQEGWTAWGKSRSLNNQGFPSLTSKPTPVIQLDIIKQNGKWRVTASDGVEQRLVAPECESIPK